jgi:hypothetical protein
VGSEDAVEVPRREAVLGKLELQRSDVPACVRDVERALAEPVPGEVAERAARLRSDDAVHVIRACLCSLRIAFCVAGPVIPSIGPA